jgi:F0F1-type ATP synthase assembly protein I
VPRTPAEGRSREACTRDGEMVKKNRGFPFSRSARSLQENASRAGEAAAASYTLVGAILVLGGLGYVVDRWQGSSPWGLLIGLALGIAVGFYELVKTAWRR